MSTMTTSVWVKLFIGENDQHPAVFKIQPIPADIDDINDLRKKIKEEMPNRLAGIDPGELDVYKPGTSYPNLEREMRFDPYDEVPKNTTGKNPLIVVAPAPVSVSFGFSQESPLV